MRISGKWIGIASTIAAVALGVVVWRQTSSGSEHPTTTDAQSGDVVGQSAREAYDELTRHVTAGNLSVEERKRRLETVFKHARAFDELIPRDTFDVQAVAERIGPDPRTLHQWVRERTTLVPYRGSLRGATGVLLDRKGNSLDRAILLASLVTARNLQVRLAHATLTPAQSRDLQRVATVTLTADTEPADVSERALSLFDALARDTGTDSARLRQQLQEALTRSQEAARQLHERIANQSARLLQDLGQTDRAGTDGSAEEEEDLRDHWWVQARDGDTWIDLDPSLSDPGRSLVPAAETLEADGIPAELHHGLTVRIVAEQWDGAGLTQHRVVSADVRPSDAIGEVIRLRHIPIAWPRDLIEPTGDHQKRITDAAVSQREWLPVFMVGTKRITAASVLDTGELNQHPGAKRPAPPTGDMLDALGGGQSAAPARFTAEWIEYEIRSPGRAARTIRREIFDLIGPAARSARSIPQDITDEQRLNRALALFGETEILVLPAGFSPTFVAHLTAASLLANEPVLTALADQSTLTLDAAERAIGLRPFPDVLHGLAVARSQTAAAKSLFLSGLNVMSRHLMLRHDGSGLFRLTQAIDMVANEMAATERNPRDRFRQRLEHGVLDANLEVMSLNPAGGVEGTADRYGRTSPNTWVAIRQVSDLTKVSIDPDNRARMEAELRNGYVLVAPQAVSTTERFGWWRIDPKTGDTLTIGDRGWGQATAEYGAVIAGSFTVGGLCLLGASIDGFSRRELLLCQGAYSIAAGMGALALGVAAAPVVVAGLLIGGGGALAAFGGMLLAMTFGG